MNNLHRKPSKDFTQVGVTISRKQLSQLDEIADVYKVPRVSLIRLAIVKFILKEYDIATRKSSIN